MASNIVLGIIFLLGGIGTLYFTYKHPSAEKPDPGAQDVAGYLGGIGLLIAGILSLLGKLKW